MQAVNLMSKSDPGASLHRAVFGMTLELLKDILKYVARELLLRRDVRVLFGLWIDSIVSMVNAATVY